VQQKLTGTQALLVYEVIEVPRSEPMLERAVRYFVGDKVVCKDFKQASSLQQKGVKEVVCEDGTCFTKGMISGGQHQNIFKL
jgi:chromosome segregation ATPase